MSISNFSISMNNSVSKFLNELYDCTEKQFEDDEATLSDLPDSLRKQKKVELVLLKERERFNRMVDFVRSTQSEQSEIEHSVAKTKTTLKSRKTLTVLRKRIEEAPIVSRRISSNKRSSVGNIPEVRVIAEKKRGSVYPQPTFKIPELKEREDVSDNGSVRSSFSEGLIDGSEDSQEYSEEIMLEKEDDEVDFSFASADEEPQGLEEANESWALAVNLVEQDSMSFDYRPEKKIGNLCSLLKGGPSHVSVARSDEFENYQLAFLLLEGRLLKGNCGNWKGGLVFKEAEEIGKNGAGPNALELFAPAVGPQGQSLPALVARGVFDMQAVQLATSDDAARAKLVPPPSARLSNKLRLAFDPATPDRYLAKLEEGFSGAFVNLPFARFGQRLRLSEGMCFALSRRAGFSVYALSNGRSEDISTAKLKTSLLSRPDLQLHCVNFDYSRAREFLDGSKLSLNKELRKRFEDSHGPFLVLDHLEFLPKLKLSRIISRNVLFSSADKSSFFLDQPFELLLKSVAKRENESQSARTKVEELGLPSFPLACNLVVSFSDGFHLHYPHSHQPQGVCDIFDPSLPLQLLPKEKAEPAQGQEGIWACLAKPEKFSSIFTSKQEISLPVETMLLIDQTIVCVNSKRVLLVK